MEYQSIIIYTIVKIRPSDGKCNTLNNLKKNKYVFPLLIYLQVFWKR